MSYCCLFSGQQHEDVRTRCKIPAGRNSIWIGDTPSQNMEENQSSQNVHFLSFMSLSSILALSYSDYGKTGLKINGSNECNSTLSSEVKQLVIISPFFPPSISASNP